MNANRLVIIQGVVVATFIVNKFLLRPFVLEGGSDGIFKIFVLSYPNFCEAIVGVSLLCFLGLTARRSEVPIAIKASNESIYLSAVLLAAVYVILQEFKIHNLGGRNVYDPYDVLFSVIGLAVGYLMLVGLRPKLRDR
jgi:hypothetical protein